MDVIYDWPTWTFEILVFVLMLAANEVGFRLGRTWHVDEPDRALSVSRAQKAAILGLVALLLGFSYSITTQRFGERQRLVLDEANAIGTCYLRAELLAEPARSRIRSILRTYTALRLEHFEKALHPDDYQRTSAAMDAAMQDLWSAVAEGVKANQEMARTAQIVPAANEVIDLSATRAWASHNHLSPAVLLLLAVCMIISSGILGHSSGQVDRRNLGLWLTLNVLILLVLYVVIDFDRPRRGFIQVSHAPLMDLQKSMKP